MSRVLVAALLIAIAGCGASPGLPASLRSWPASVTDTVWMHVDGEWERPPAGMGYPKAYGSAPATLIRFTANREFSMLQCWVVGTGARLSISPGDPHRVFLGTWTATGGGADVIYRLVDELVQPAGGGRYPGPETGGAMEIRRGAVWFGGVQYQKSRIDATKYEEFVGPQRARQIE